MSVVEYSRNSGLGIAAALYNTFDRIRTQNAQRATYSRVYNELVVLSDRDLADIGIARSDITDIAQEAAIQAR